jgi:hypothetical protein
MILSSCIILAWLPAPAQPADDDAEFFYYYGDEKVPLALSRERLGVLFEPGLCLTRKEEIVASDPVLDALEPLSLNLWGLEMIPLVPGLSKEDVLAAEARLWACWGVEYASIVVRGKGDELVPSDEFTARFQAGVTEEEVRAMNALHGVEISRKRDSSFRTLYDLRVLDPRTTRGLEMANRYHEDPRVTWAAPEWLTPTVRALGLSDDLYAFLDSEVLTLYLTILDRRPSLAEAGGWVEVYWDQVADLRVALRVIMAETARTFFLSDEYGARSLTNEQFITDCYQALLERDPTHKELFAWLAGAWERAEVVAAFVESEEFAQRVPAWDIALPGDAARNFVTTMYVGFLDRLADRAGLECAALLLDQGYRQGGIEGVRAQAKQTAREVIASEEFLSKQPTTADRVVGFYRAFLGRFPNDAEKAWWPGELDAGRETTDSLIDRFADSEEFTARLTRFFGTGYRC